MKQSVCNEVAYHGCTPKRNTQRCLLVIFLICTEIYRNLASYPNRHYAPPNYLPLLNGFKFRFNCRKQQSIGEILSHVPTSSQIVKSCTLCAVKSSMKRYSNGRATMQLLPQDVPLRTVTVSERPTTHYTVTVSRRLTTKPLPQDASLRAGTASERVAMHSHCLRTHHCT